MTAQEQLLLIFGLILLLLYWQLARHRVNVVSRYLNLENLALPKRSALAYLVRTVCLFASWLLLWMAFVRSQEALHAPQMPGAEGQRPKVDEVAFVLDVSASMTAQDSSTGSSRFSRAKDLIDATLENLGGINISLYAFAGNTIDIVPPTLDYLYFRILLQSTDINETGVSGTDLLAMGQTIKANYEKSPWQKSVLVVLLTDGEDTDTLNIASLITLVSDTTRNGLRWNIVGLGNPEGTVVPNIMYEGKPVISKLDASLLQRMAQAGHGHYYGELQDPLSEIVDNLLGELAVNPGFQEVSQVYQRAMPPAPPAGILLLLTGAFLFLLAALMLPEAAKLEARR